MIDLEEKRRYQGQLLTEAQIEEKRRYGRERGKAIRRGTWSGHRAPGPTREATEMEIAWVAGFFQGEGYVRNDRAGVTVSQCERDPLELLVELFGGTIRLARRRTKGWNEVYTWNCCGKNSRRFAVLIEPWLVGLKREQMRERLLPTEEAIAS